MPFPLLLRSRLFGTSFLVVVPPAPAAPTLRPSPSRCTLYVHVDGVRPLLFSLFLSLPRLPNPCLLLRVPCISEVVWHGRVRVCACIVNTLCAPLLLPTATAVWWRWLTNASPELFSRESEVQQAARCEGEGEGR